MTMWQTSTVSMTASCSSNTNTPPKSRADDNAAVSAGFSQISRQRFEPFLKDLREQNYNALQKASLRYAFCASICVEALLRKSEPMGAKLLPIVGEKNRTQSRRRLLGFPKSHGNSFRQFEKNFVNKVSITRARRVSLRQRPTFAHTCAHAERGICAKQN